MNIKAPPLASSSQKVRSHEWSMIERRKRKLVSGLFQIEAMDRVGEAMYRSSSFAVALLASFGGFQK